MNEINLIINLERTASPGHQDENLQDRPGKFQCQLLLINLTAVVVDWKLTAIPGTAINNILMQINNQELNKNI
jgi:hypothetical protein